MLAARAMRALAPACAKRKDQQGVKKIARSENADAQKEAPEGNRSA